jgi:hypothetical protein
MRNDHMVSYFQQHAQAPSALTLSVPDKPDTLLHQSSDVEVVSKSSVCGNDTDPEVQRPSFTRGQLTHQQTLCRSCSHAHLPIFLVAMIIWLGTSETSVSSIKAFSTCTVGMKSTSQDFSDGKR